MRRWPAVPLAPFSTAWATMAFSRSTFACISSS